MAKYEKKHGLPSQYLNVAITAKGKDGAFQKLETGKIKIRDFYDEVRPPWSSPQVSLETAPSLEGI